MIRFIHAARERTELIATLIGFDEPIFTPNDCIAIIRNDDGWMNSLSAYEKESTTSDKTGNTPRWIRKLRNENSNEKMRKLGLVDDVDYGVENGMTLTHLALTITDPEIENLFSEEVIGLYGYNAPLVECKKIPAKTVSSSYPIDALAHAAALKRSGGCCDACGRRFALDLNRQPTVHIIHHIFDIFSTDESIMPKKRYDNIDFITALCGACHDNAHQGFNGVENDYKLLIKIQKMNVLVDILLKSKNLEPAVMRITEKRLEALRNEKILAEF